MTGSATLPLVDHHVHGLVTHDLDRDRFELLINEGGRPAPAGTSHFDSPVGLAVLSRCGPLLDLPPGAGPDRYIERRGQLGAAEVNQRLVRAAGLTAMLIDTGHRGEEIASPEEMAGISGVPVREISRIERVAEQVAQRCDGPRDWVAHLGEELDAAGRRSAGFKSIVAYRYGFDLDVAPPAPGEVLRAAQEWFAESGGPKRLTAPVLLAHTLHTVFDVAATRGLPIQLHTGFGDTDLTLPRTDPTVFTPWVRRADALGVTLVFLHCYPYQRQAGYLASVYPNVYFDVGCMFHYTGASATTVLAEALELAPFTKQLFSTDAFGLAEFVYLGAALFRRSLSRVLDRWVAEENCPPATVERIRDFIGAGNARRIYRLDTSETDHPRS